MTRSRECSCGKKVELDIKTAARNADGYWVNCTCESTLFFPHETHTQIKARLAKGRQETNQRIIRGLNKGKKV